MHPWIIGIQSGIFKVFIKSKNAIIVILWGIYVKDVVRRKETSTYWGGSLFAITYAFI